MKQTTGLDYIRIAGGWLAFGAIVGLVIYGFLLNVDTQAMTPELWGKIIMQSVMTLLLVSVGVDAVYSTVKSIIIGIGGRHYNGDKVKSGIGYRYVYASENVRNTKSTIDRYGMVIELEESIDFINMENKAASYEHIIDKKIFKYGKKLGKKKTRNNKEKSTEIKEIIVKLKSDKKILGEYKLSITRYQHEKCEELDNQLADLHGEPKYSKVYAKDIFNLRSPSVGVIGRLMNSGFMGFLKWRVKPIAMPIITTILFTYYIIQLSDEIDPANLALMVAVLTTASTSMLKAIIGMITGRFERVYLQPIENNSYIFNKFNSRHKAAIDQHKRENLPDDVQKLIDQYEVK